MNYLARISASQIVRVATNGERFKIGQAMDDVCVLHNGSIIVDHDGMFMA